MPAQCGTPCVPDVVRDALLLVLDANPAGMDAKEILTSIREIYGASSGIAAAFGSEEAVLGLAACFPEYVVTIPTQRPGNRGRSRLSLKPGIAVNALISGRPQVPAQPSLPPTAPGAPLTSSCVLCFPVLKRITLIFLRLRSP